MKNINVCYKYILCFLLLLLTFIGTYFVIKNSKKDNLRMTIPCDENLNFKNNNIGCLYLNSKDKEKAFEFFKIACLNGNYKACKNIIISLNRKKFFPIVVKYYQEKCSNLNLKYCNSLGHLYAHLNLNNDALYYFMHACTATDNEYYCSDMLTFFHKQKYNKALRIFITNCKKLTDKKCYANIYSFVKEKNFNTALDILNKLCFYLKKNFYCQKLKTIQEHIANLNPKLKKAFSVCKNSHIQACYQNANKLLLSQNITKAEKLFKATCDLGFENSCKQLADIYFSKDMITEAHKIYLSYCIGNDIWGCIKLAEIFTKRNKIKKAEKILQDSCSDWYKGYPCLAYGLFLLDRKRVEEAKSVFESMLNDGEPYGYIGLAKLALKNKKIYKATKYNEKACTLNIREACFNLGQGYLIVEKRTKALAYFQKACSLGLEKACDNAIETKQK